MKAFLLFADRDFDWQAPLCWNADTLLPDLSLSTLLDAMSAGDPVIHDVATRVLLTAADDPADVVRYRQSVLRDAIRNPDVVRDLYRLTVEGLENRRKGWFGVLGHHAAGILYGAIGLLRLHLGTLQRLREVAEDAAPRVESAGFRQLFAMLASELSDAYLAEIEGHLEALDSSHGVLMSARLGPENASRDHTLQRPQRDGRNWLVRLLAKDPPGLTFHLAERDTAGGQLLSELHNRGVNRVANVLAQSSEHVDSFFQMLRAELAFYVGCLNLHDRLVGLGEPTCFPSVSPAASQRWRAEGLYEPCLALETGRAVVGTDLDAGGRPLVIVTGANQGGKSVFLRAVGVAQLMLRCGMFVAARAYEAEIRSVATHYKREEDATLKAGKFAEELARLSDMADHLERGSLVLFNESFAATNEREGSEVARQVITALVEAGITVVFVTHLHAFAQAFHERAADRAAFLRAERLADGTRTFRLVPGAPLATSHARDLFARILGGGHP